MTIDQLFYQFMLVYQHVFSPVYLLLVFAVLLIYHEHKDFGNSLYKRLLVIFLSWLTAYVIYMLYYIFNLNSLGHQWIEDLFAVTGLLTSVVICALVWNRNRWGGYVPLAIETAVVLSVIYMLISYFWNISGHVAYVTAPVIFMSLVADRRYFYIMPIPLLMVINRPIVHAHTWLQSVLGFVLGVVVVILVVRLRREKYVVYRQTVQQHT